MIIIQRLKVVGPGAMVAAVFIGPGTVTTASVTGAEFGYPLLWTIAFSVVATIVLQEMSARLGLVSVKSSVANALGAVVTLIVVWLRVRTILDVAGLL